MYCSCGSSFGQRYKRLDDIEEWDSLSHVQLVAAMEEAFGIEFSSREILSWDNVGDLIDSIQKKV